MKERERSAWRRIVLWLLTAVLLPVVTTGSANADEAYVEYTNEAGIVPRSSAVLWTDGDINTRAALPATITLPADGAAKLLYLEFYEQPYACCIEQYDAEGRRINRIDGTGPMLNRCFTVSSGTVELRITGDAWLATLRIFAAGTLPEEIHIWQPTAQKADIMIISAHPDDEHLYMGGIMPTYAGERGYSVVVVYMTCGERVRHNEALEGDWINGVRNYPVFYGLRDIYTSSAKSANHYWGGEEVAQSLIEDAIRRCHPEVIVTHGVDGEYGHGAHCATAEAALAAVKALAAAEDGWAVQKLYWHLGAKNPITMDWRVPLEAFGGKTAFDMAKLGYKAHLSQTRKFKLGVRDSGEHSCAAYGLEWSCVGEDVLGGDLLENIPPERLSNYVSPTPAPTPTLAPAATSTQQSVTTPAQQLAATPAPQAAPGRWTAPLVYGLLLLAVLGVILYWIGRKKV